MTIQAQYAFGECLVCGRKRDDGCDAIDHDETLRRLEAKRLFAIEQQSTYIPSKRQYWEREQAYWDEKIAARRKELMGT